MMMPSTCHESVGVIRMLTLSIDSRIDALSLFGRSCTFKKMSIDSMLEDYYSQEKLEQLVITSTDQENPSISTRYYTLYSLLPDLKNKVVLDLPCSLGVKSRSFIMKYGAQKVLGVDIVQKQLDFAKELDSVEGIKDRQIEYICHDAKIPKTLSSSIADVCVAAHLFCFAENFDELVCLAKCAFLNLKNGGMLYSFACSINKIMAREILIEKFESFDYFVSHIDPSPNDTKVPRRLKYSNDGFNYDVMIWDPVTITKALEVTGFSNIKVHPIETNPEYKGRYDLGEYLKLIDGTVIVATKVD